MLDKYIDAINYLQKISPQNPFAVINGLLDDGAICETTAEYLRELIFDYSPLLHEESFDEEEIFINR
jgi:hypothetical protein